MEIELVTDINELRIAAEMAANNHRRLRMDLGFLPSREAEDFLPRIEWIFKNGSVMGAFEKRELIAFLGGFTMENYRNAGPGAYCPDWCRGALASGTELEANGTSKSRPERRIGSAFRAYRELYRALAPLWIGKGARIHGISVYVSEPEALEAFSLTGFGRIVMDAARPTAELVAELGGTELEFSASIRIKRAETFDAGALAELNARLAKHIESSPVLVPDPRGLDRHQWEEWLAEPETVAFLAECEGRPVAFIKAQDPQFDVSFSVHGKMTLGINGMYTDKTLRGRGLGRALLARIARYAAERGKPLVSVDCETTNPEAFAFWTRYFRPFAWSLERRV